VGDVINASIVTIEGLSPDASHPLQKAWLTEQVPQCGYCESGQIMKAVELLASIPNPSRSDIITQIQSVSAEWGVPLSELRTEASTVIHVPADRRISYGQIVRFAQVPA